MSCDVLSEFVSVFVCVCVCAFSAAKSLLRCLNHCNQCKAEQRKETANCQPSLSAAIVNGQLANCSAASVTLQPIYPLQHSSIYRSSYFRVPSSLFFRLTTFSILISLFSRPLCLSLVHSSFPQRANQFSNCFASYPQRENWRTLTDRTCSTVGNLTSFC